MCGLTIFSLQLISGDMWINNKQVPLGTGGLTISIVNPHVEPSYRNTCGFNKYTCTGILSCKIHMWINNYTLPLVEPRCKTWHVD